MASKRIFVFVFLLLLAIFTWNFYSPKVEKSLNREEESIAVVKPVSPKVVEKPQLKTVKSPPEKTPTTGDSKHEVLLDVVYDDDPVVNASMLLHENVLCIRHLSDSKNYEQYLQLFKARLDENQQKFYDKFTQYCQKLNKQHPEYHLTDKKILNQQKNKAQAVSLWGEIIKGEKLATDLTDSEVRGLLSSGSLNVLTQAPQYLREFYQKTIHWDLESVLGNHQYDYVEYIQNYAHQLYLCQSGADCSAYSSTMVMLCYLNSKGCGLDYPSYIQQVLTQGQQADIALALDYLKSQYN